MGAGETRRPSAVEQFELLAGDAAEVVPADELRAKLEAAARSGRPLRVKLGLDPTAGQVTLGWAVVLWKLRRFQDLGHTAVLIVGDFTAMVGDPSGRSSTRPRLSGREVREYAADLLEQFWLILDRDRTEVRYNSEWLSGMGMEEVLELTASQTVARTLERDDFAKRYAAGEPISIMEFLYPLLQGRDSVAVRADVELGGTDQKFNLLVGRDLQRRAGQEPQVALTMPLLVGLDGRRKMSQSLGNYVGITDPPEEMFGKLMSIPDDLIVQYTELCSGAGREGARAVREGLDTGTLGANEAKRRMARGVVARYAGEAAARTAEESFDLVHRRRELPGDVPLVALPDGEVWLPRLLADLGLASSSSDGRRLIEQGGVRIDGRAVTEPADVLVEDLRGKIIQVGRRRFVRIG